MPKKAKDVVVAKEFGLSAEDIEQARLAKVIARRKVKDVSVQSMDRNERKRQVYAAMDPQKKKELIKRVSAARKRAKNICADLPVNATNGDDDVSMVDGVDMFSSVSSEDPVSNLEDIRVLPNHVVDDRAMVVDEGMGSRNFQSSVTHVSHDVNDINLAKKKKS